jgi:uncharacterized RDD family membrane protein YckC
MTQWYYVSPDHQRQGPVGTVELAVQFHRGLLSLETLVWRDGLEQWQPLGDFAEELGLLRDGPAITLAKSKAGTTSGDPAAPAPSDVEPDTPYAPPSANLVTTAGEIVQSGLVVYAGFWKRYAANCIDGFLLAIVSYLIFFVVILGVGAGLRSFESLDSNAFGGVSMLFMFGAYGILIAIQAIYFTWMHASGNQATLGKMAVGIKVVDARGRAVSTGQSFGRWAALFFFGALSCNIVNLVSAFMAGLGQRKQAVHDLVAGTLVVDKWAFTAHPERQRRDLGAVTITIIVISALILLGYIVFAVMIAAIGANEGWR